MCSATLLAFRIVRFLLPLYTFRLPPRLIIAHHSSIRHIRAARIHKLGTKSTTRGTHIISSALSSHHISSLRRLLLSGPVLSPSLLRPLPLPRHIKRLSCTLLPARTIIGFSTPRPGSTRCMFPESQSHFFQPRIPLPPHAVHGKSIRPSQSPAQERPHGTISKEPRTMPRNSCRSAAEETKSLRVEFLTRGPARKPKFAPRTKGKG